MARLLIIDDCKEIRTLVALFLTREKHAIATLSSPLELNNYKQLENFDLILLDINMPEMNGVDFATSITRELGRKRPLLVFFTSEGQLETVTRVLKLRPEGFLLKPAKKDQMINLLNGLLKGHKLKRYYEVPIDKRRQGSLCHVAPGNIARFVSISEIGIKMSCPMPFKAEAQLNLQTQIFGDIGLENLPTKVISQMKDEQGDWLVDLQFEDLPMRDYLRLKDWIRLNS